MLDALPHLAVRCVRQDRIEQPALRRPHRRAVAVLPRIRSGDRGRDAARQSFRMCVRDLRRQPSLLRNDLIVVLGEIARQRCDPHCAAIAV